MEEEEVKGISLDLTKTDEQVYRKGYVRYVKRLNRVIKLGITPVRQPGEAFDDYKLRKNYLTRQIKLYKRGILIYSNLKSVDEKNVPYAIATHGTISNDQKAKILKRNERDKRRMERRSLEKSES